MCGGHGESPPAMAAGGVTDVMSGCAPKPPCGGQGSAGMGVGRRVHTGSHVLPGRGPQHLLEQLSAGTVASTASTNVTATCIAGRRIFGSCSMNSSQAASTI